jgi:CRISPR-associated protein Csm3
MTENNQTSEKQRGLDGKILITGVIQCKTGLHIGGGKDNMAIGVVDSVVVRDPLNRQPIIPGSSLKGKMRTLLAKVTRPTTDPFLPKHQDDSTEINHLFGSSGGKSKSEGKTEKKSIITSRLQFFDARMTEDSVKKLGKAETDLYLTEVKYENTINRVTSEAMPRQIERVPAGAEFEFRLMYLIETGIDKEEILQDFNAIVEGLNLLQEDYLGGHGTRGSGRIAFTGLKYDLKRYFDKTLPINETELQSLLELVTVRSQQLMGASV